MLRSRYPPENLPSLERVSDCWMNQFFMRKLLYNKGYMISIKHVYSETCKNYYFAVPTFAKIKHLIAIQFYNETLFQLHYNSSREHLIDKSTFLTNNKDVSIPKRKDV